MRRIRDAVLVLIMMMMAWSVAGQDVAAEDAAEPLPSEQTPGPAALLGFIFNTNSLLLNLESYKGGLGGMLRYPDSSFRVLVDLSHASGINTLGVGVGVVYQKPFFSGRVEPYWGLMLDAGFEREKTIIDPDDYDQIDVLTASAGGVLGAEIFLFDFISLFGEYQLALDVSRTAIAQSVGGTVTESSTFNYAVGIALGNNASIGVVIYLKPLGIVAADESE